MICRLVYLSRRIIKMSNLSKRVMAIAVTVALSFTFASSSALAAATNYYHNWNNGKGSYSGHVNGTASSGAFGFTWDSNGSDGANAINGKGWKPCDASSKKISYNMGSYNNTGGSNGCSYFSFYGWTSSPLTEYYVVDSWKNWRPVYGSSLATISVDGSSYNVYKANVTGQPSIAGNSSNFTQYWSVRTSALEAGAGNKTITVSSHVNAWKNQGFAPKTWDYGVMAFEMYQSKGNGNATVWE